MSRAAIKFICCASLLAGILAGCSVGPDYHPPNVSAPAKWSAHLAGGETNGIYTNSAWWENFGDPELNSLVQRALATNLDLKIAEARVREARAQYKITAADNYPTVDANGSFDRQRISENGDFPSSPNFPQEYNLYQAGFDSTWEIDVFGGTRRATEAARAQIAAAELGRRDAQVTLLGEVARNYIETRSYQRRLAITFDNIKAEADSLGLTKDRYTNGLATDLNVQQAATVLANTRAEVPDLRTGLSASIHRLSVLLAQPPGALESELSKSAPIPPAPPEVPVGLPSDLLLRRPDVQEAERQLAAATAQIGVARADLFPKFSLTGTAGLQSISFSDWFDGGSRFWTVGPTMTWRIFDAGHIRGNIRLQTARQQEALAQYEQIVLSAFEDVENALVAYAQEQLRRRALADAVKSSQQSLQLSRQLYANGLADFLNVIDAETSLYQAQDQLVQSDRTVSVNVVALYKALGGGWETNAPVVESAQK